MITIYNIISYELFFGDYIIQIRIIKKPAFLMRTPREFDTCKTKKSLQALKEANFFVKFRIYILSNIA